MSLPASLVDSICSHRGAITKAWLRALRNSPKFSTPEDISAPQLIDHLPNLFDDFASYLRDDAAPHAEHDARVHGRYRWKQHFRIDEVLRELLVIRDIIITEIDRYMGEQKAAVTLEAHRRVTRFFDHALLYSVSQFSEQQQVQTDTDKRLLAAEHQSIEAGMKAVDSSRLRLLRTIVHELCNTMNAAMLTSENLAIEEDSASRMELHEMLRRCHGQTTTLINQLLEIAPLLAGRESLRLAPLDLHGFAAEQRRVFKSMAIARNLRFRCSAPEALPEVVTDESKLQRIVSNLVENALKYTPAGGSTELRFEPLDIERWTLSVSDTGPGIPEEHRTKIFEEFHRVPGTEQDGNGLGLSIVRQLVDLFDGNIDLESEMGRGSTFRVTLSRNPHTVA